MATTQDMTASFLAGLHTAPSGPEWLDEFRSRSAEVLERLGLPSRRSEAFRYTDLRFLLELGAPEVPPSASPPEAFLDGPRLSIACGRAPAERVALGSGAWVQGISGALSEDPEFVAAHLGALADPEKDRLAALSGARFSDGFVVYLPRGVRVDPALEIDFWDGGSAEPGVVLARNLVVVEEGAELVLLESHRSGGGGASTSVTTTEIHCGEGARVQHYRCQLSGREESQLGSSWVQLEKDASYRSFELALGGRIVRTETRAELAATGSEIQLSGLSLGREEEQRDSYIEVDHRGSHGRSRQMFRGVMNDRATGTFNGKVTVHKGAEGCDAAQSNKNLLLSPGARVNTRPQLEIYTDDVTACHGATVGQLDTQALFYLRSRGIPEEEARGLMVRAFVQEVVDEVPEGRLRDIIEERVFDALAESGACR